MLSNMAADSPTALFKATDDTESFVRQARRAQIVDVAIGVIADVGLPAASTVAIARRAGISRGVLTYHFRDRADLLDAVVERVYRVAREQLAHRVASAGTPDEALRTFVAGSIDYYVAYPDHMAALSAIYTAGERTGSGRRDDRGDHRQEMDDGALLLTAGQQDGRFRAFDVGLMAASVRALLDLALARVRRGEDPQRITDELTSTVRAMTEADR